MDMPTRLELEKLVEQLRADLPDAQFEAAAAIITHAIMLIERGVDGERQVVRAERELLEQQERAVEADRRALFEERKELELARAALEKEREIAGMRSAAGDGLRALTSALQSGEE
ncbi:MAG: hypothetical protein Q7T82_08775 [Armatimonadota bacterium]|nr:hypothetical protein [Armatimonadota bacterium]